MEPERRQGRQSVAPTSGGPRRRPAAAGARHWPAAEPTDAAEHREAQEEAQEEEEGAGEAVGEAPLLARRRCLARASRRLRERPAGGSRPPVTSSLGESSGERTAGGPPPEDNNGRARPGQANKPPWAYPKILGQYLPSSFNLNCTLASAAHWKKGGAGGRNSGAKLGDCEPNCAGGKLVAPAESEQRAVVGEPLARHRRQPDRRQEFLTGASAEQSRRRTVTESIANALARFKLSAAPTRATGSKSAHNGRLSARTQVGSAPFAPLAPPSQPASPAATGHQVRRKLLMHLRRRGIGLAGAPSPGLASGRLAEPSAGAKWPVVDLNNNALASLISAARCHHHHQQQHQPANRARDDHKTRLLLDQEPDEHQDDDADADHDHDHDHDHYHECSVAPTRANSKPTLSKMTGAKTDAKTGAGSGRSSWTAGGRPGGARYRPKPDRRALIGQAGGWCALALGLLLGLVSLGASQQPAGGPPTGPFARSQPQPAGSGAAGPVGPAAGGGMGPVVVGGAGGGRPAVGAPQPAAGSLVASINCNKIRGHVTLTPNLQGGATVTTQISAGPPGEVYQWSIHQFPVKPGAAMCSCSPLILGSRLVDLSEMHGNLPSDQEFSVQTSLELFGPGSPVGHSLQLRGMKTGIVACATFLPTSRKSNYRAKFHAPISGSVTIFQTAFGTAFVSHLMYSNGTRRHSMHRFDLVRSEDDVLTTTSLLSGSPAAPPVGGQRAPDQSQTGLEQREHDNELAACRRFTTGEPLFNNITYQLAVSTENFGMRGRTSLVLPQIPFETFSSVYVVIYSEHEPGEPIACAPLRFVKPKTAAAKLQTVSVQGSVVFSQESPYDVTVVRVNLNFPNSDGHSYGIDELPMIIRRKSDTRVCPNIREIIYNPHHVEPSSVPAEGEATSDQYAVGDLSGKYGSLSGKASEKIQVNDHNLPLFGPVSIIGRALTVYSAEGVAIACSNVELTQPMTTAFATFDYGIQGQFIFRQPMNDCNGDTYVYIEVSRPTSGLGAGAPPGAGQGAHADHASRSLDHNWHIHVNPVDSGLDHLSTTDCAPAGAHFNPYNTSTSAIYARDCTPFNVLRCELGDLSAKMFTIEIPPYRVKGAGQEPDIGKFFGTDIDLPLCGPVSIVNRSVVVHVADFGPQRLACSTVIEFKPRS